LHLAIGALLSGNIYWQHSSATIRADEFSAPGKQPLNVCRSIFRKDATACLFRMTGLHPLPQTFLAFINCACRCNMAYQQMTSPATLTPLEGVDHFSHHPRKNRYRPRCFAADRHCSVGAGLQVGQPVSVTIGGLINAAGMSVVLLMILSRQAMRRTRLMVALLPHELIERATFHLNNSSLAPLIFMPHRIEQHLAQGWIGKRFDREVPVPNLGYFSWPRCHALARFDFFWLTTALRLLGSAGTSAFFSTATTGDAR